MGNQLAWGGDNLQMVDQVARKRAERAFLAPQERRRIARRAQILRCAKQR